MRTFLLSFLKKKITPSLKVQTLINGNTYLIPLPKKKDKSSKLPPRGRNTLRSIIITNIANKMHTQLNGYFNDFINTLVILTLKIFLF